MGGGTPPALDVGGDNTGTVASTSGDIITGDLDQIAGTTTGTPVWSISTQPSLGIVTVDQNGTWTYDYDEANDSQLDPDGLTDDFFVITYTRNGETTTEQINITITGTGDIVCFVEGALIQTDSGWKKIENLKPGEMVRTRDHGMQPIKWIGEFTTLAEGQYLPVVFPKRCFLANRPKNELMLSRAHLVMVGMLGKDVPAQYYENLAPAHFFTLPEAKHLFRQGRAPHILGKNARSQIRYFHLLFEGHELIKSEGVITESLRPGELLQEVIDNGDLATMLNLEEFVNSNPSDMSVRPIIRKEDFIKLCKYLAKARGDVESELRSA